MRSASTALSRLGLTLLLGALPAAALTIPVRPPLDALPEILPVGAPAQLPAPALIPNPAAGPASGPVASPPASTAAPALARPPTDPLYSQQWTLPVIRAPQAWALPGAQAAQPVTVAVLDTGFVTSTELAGRAVNGYDFVSDPARAGDGGGRDADGSGVGPYAFHGEVVANIIAAAHDGRGMAGLNPRARVVHVRVAGTDGQIDVPDLVDGLKWAAGLTVPGVPVNPNPARLLNLSLFADFIPLTRCDPRVQAAVDAVTARSALVIAGAANDGADAFGYSPAGCRNVLTVTSVTVQGARPAYANWGRSVALAAPGGEVGHGVTVSSVSGAGGVRDPNGTSLAAPHVTGVASLLLGVRPNLTPASLRRLLTGTAVPFPGGHCDPQPARSCGAGTLNAEAALKSALSSSLGK
ncbi:S8 family serine peptidase [Deinococcus aquaticus]|uniref:S8 family serine peptidase n=1 Tax=Deinococcus aquaticus TaxID=328692 RepID=A0ABY7UWH7_9DEIO|nr:S8 family serine peptidase [Deinococcus aquaticus]WDA57257.1 S8 family serine peptidase [Deinococcus aquaticus]